MLTRPGTVSRHRDGMTDHTRAWRRLAALPLLLLLGSAATLVLAGAIIDATPLEQVPDSWGYVAGAIIFSVLYGMPAAVVAGVLALVASQASPPWARRLAWAATATSAACGVGMLVLGVLLVVGVEEAGRVFGSVTAALGVVVSGVPLVLVRRQHARAGSDAALRSRRTG